jgi:hypothetical protein
MKPSTKGKSKFNRRLWQLERQIEANTPLAPDALQVAVHALQSSSLDDKLLACQALLRHTYSAQLMARAVDVARRLCEDTLRGEGQWHPNLVLLLLFLPKNALEGDEVFRRFAYAAAKSTDPACRADGTVALFRFASAGDGEAVRLLRTAADDADPFVRQNATSSLRRLG